MIWKDISLEYEDFFPSQESLLPWQQQKIFSETGWVSERMSWADHGRAVLNKKALSLTVSRVLLLPSHCSPFPSISPAWPHFFSLISDLWIISQLVTTHLTASPFHQFFHNPFLFLSFLSSSRLLLYIVFDWPLICWCYPALVCSSFWPLCKLILRAANVQPVLVACAGDIEDQCSVVPNCKSQALSIM